MKNNKKYLYIFLILLIIFFSFCIFRVYLISKNKTIVQAIIKNVYVSNRTSPIIDAEFYYKNIKYKSSTRIKGYDCTLENFYKRAFMRKIYVIFDSLNPNNNILITERSDYKKYNLPYPSYIDSLKNCNK